MVLIPSIASALQEGDHTYEVIGSPAVANITGYTGPGGNLIIPSTIGGYVVAGIDEYAFNYKTALTSVVIPDSVVTIGYAAFYHCTALRSVTMGSSVENLSHGIFYACSSLVSIKFLASPRRRSGRTGSTSRLPR